MKAVTSLKENNISTTEQNKKVNQEEIGKAWDKIAKGYDRTNTVTQMWLGNEGLLRAGLRRGNKFLDVASGSGALSIPAARLGAEVTAVDISPNMLELLKARASKENLKVEIRIMDGHSLDFDDNIFDIAGSQFGVMLFPDVHKAISEMVRVVKPGGSVLITAYGNPHQIDFLKYLVDAVQSVRPEFDGPPMDPPPLEFQLSDPEKLKKVFTDAGLKNVYVETIIETTSFKSGSELWDWIINSNPIVMDIFDNHLNLSDAERNTVQQTLNKIFSEKSDSSGIAKLQNPVNIAVGTKKK